MCPRRKHSQALELFGLKLNLDCLAQCASLDLFEGYQLEPYNPEAPGVPKFNSFPGPGPGLRPDEGVPPYQPHVRSSLVSVPTITPASQGVFVTCVYLSRVSVKQIATLLFVCFPCARVNAFLS